MQLGLHRPEYIQDFSRVERQLSVEGIQDSVRIWAACYIAAQCITSSIGQESILKPDQMITRACEPSNIYQLPIGLHQHLRLMKFSVHVSKILSENSNTASGLPDERDRVHIMDRLQLEFDDLKSQLEVNATIVEKVYISCTQLQLQVFYFFEGIQPEKRKEGLLKCYETASTMIETMKRAELEISSVVYSPYQSYRLVLVAGIVLMRILISSYSDLVDFKVGKQNFNTSIRLLRRFSLQDNDTAGRGSKILSQLWIHYQNSPHIRESPPSLQIKSRLGGSLLHDSLWIWRRECDDQKASHRGTRQNSPHKSSRQDWANQPLTNPLQSSNSSNDSNNNEMNDILNFSGIENLDISWLDGANLLSWLLPGTDFNQPTGGPTINVT
ncbi:uncharacterized protein BP5553_01535 [Venustampulla echinocandica]|uniref:Transcription factor domain-containing protein n=1 Tax=Venustampulla echinocandica TaxID=2656787 RepID=A0A370U1A0_9HELO|nr:uncharacterized protein BP5553_01535 [Venustampulla echinocandica]RDL41556.1 hypothetical protein BP5553_01535 [Venustampulla echinocandica]